MAISTQCATTGNGGRLTVAAPLQADNVTADPAVADFFANLNIVSIEPSEETLERIDCSHLGTVGSRSYIPADLADSPQFTVVANFNSGRTPAFMGQLLGATTIIFPLMPGEATNATWAAEAFVLSRTMPRLVNGELAQITLLIQFADAPTFTPAT